MNLTTYRDLIDHLTDWLGANPGAEVQRDCRRAIFQALRELEGRGNWAYYTSAATIALRPVYSAGTCAYNAATRTVTLTGGVWPSWAASGEWVRDGQICEVSQRVDDATLVLAARSAPASSLPAGPYQLHCDRYLLPQNFRQIISVSLNGQSLLRSESPSQWLTAKSADFAVGTPTYFALLGEPDYYDAVSLAVRPTPAESGFLCVNYLRRPRDLRIDDHSVGQVNVEASSDLVTGIQTQWTKRLEGTVFRCRQGTAPPGAWWSNEPPELERIVMAVVGPGQLRLDAASPEAFSKAAYRLSDPIDIEQTAMLTALLRCAECYVAAARGKDERMRDRLSQEYIQALLLAREVDARYVQAGRLVPDARVRL